MRRCVKPLPQHLRSALRRECGRRTFKDNRRVGVSTDHDGKNGTCHDAEPPHDGTRERPASSDGCRRFSVGMKHQFTGGGVAPTRQTSLLGLLLRASALSRCAPRRRRTGRGRGRRVLPAIRRTPTTTLRFARGRPLLILLSYGVRMFVLAAGTVRTRLALTESVKDVKATFPRRGC